MPVRRASSPTVISPSRISLTEPVVDISESDDIRRVVSNVLSASPFRLPAAPLETDLVAKYFRGLGDPIRLRILELLQREGELTVGALVERLGLPQPNVSNHLACLRWCGFVEARREGRTVFNRIADPRVGATLELAQSLLADNAEHVAACCRIEERER
jgi:DNA-binding transcriptional ArsR family regulator